jgi:hypothetical protein
MSKNQTIGIKSTWGKAVLLVYPYLLAYYPVFALRNHNIIYVDLSTILRSLILVTAGTTVIAVITYLFVRNLVKFGIIVSVIIMMFFSYGHLYIQIEDSIGNPIQHRYLLGVEILILLVVTVFILKKDQVARVVSQFLSTVSIVLLGIALFESARYDIGVYRSTAAVTKREVPSTSYQDDGKPPDFYLIILDGHARSDLLKSSFEYDNTNFIHQLNEMGFYVTNCSQSNYASTKLALLSFMYGDYIQNFAEAGTPLPPLKTSAVNQTLKSLGYKTITFENSARGHFDLKEDIRLSRNQMSLGKFDLRTGISEFEKMMFDTSFLRFVVDTELIPGLDNTTLLEWEQLEHYYQTHYILSELEEIPEIPGPKFIFAHIMVPHPPYIFSPDGSYLGNNHPNAGYGSSVEFIDSRLPFILQAIIEKSDPPPIIVVMGDHGPAVGKTITKEMHMATLNAYLVNEGAKAQLYPTLTPINAFRIILNAHYGSTYPLLEDVSYYAHKESQLPDAEIISNNCQAAP